MSEAVWRLGPAGNLRALIAPEPGIKDTSVRYGGVHQGLSGARTVDVTGHRREYSFDWKYLEKQEWAWLEALHTRLIPGPLYLLDPRRKNRLSAQAAALKALPSGRGLGVSGTVWTSYQLDAPPEVGLAVRCSEIATFAAADAVRFDFWPRTPVLPGETLTTSLYVRAPAASQTFSVYVDYYDAAGARINPSGFRSATATTSWSRVVHTVTPPPGTASIVLALVMAAQTSPFRFAAPQIEAGSVATEWELGGGSALVSVDQLDTSSPLFPLSDCSMTLLEV